MGSPKASGSGCETRREHLGSPESPKACEVCVKGLKLVTRACVLMMGSSSAFQGLLESWQSFPLKVMDCSDSKGNISFELEWCVWYQKCSLVSTAQICSCC